MLFTVVHRVQCFGAILFCLINIYCRGKSLPQTCSGFVKKSRLPLLIGFVLSGREPGWGKGGKLSFALF